MKKLLAFLIVLVVALSACLPVSAKDACNHDFQGVEVIDSYGITFGCTRYDRDVILKRCTECGWQRTVYDDTLIETNHIVELVAEWCDGYMHNLHYSCACGEINHTESDWCSDPDNCPYRGRKR